MAREKSARLEDVQIAAATLKSAEARIAQIEAQITRTASTLQADETRLGFTRLYAPIAGIVTNVDVKEGQTLNATYQTPTVLRIADVSRMTVWADVAEADIGRVRVGMPLRFTTLVDLAVPIFNAGRLAAGRDVTLAQREALLASYRQAIVAAIADVEVALNAVTSLQRQARLQAEELAQAERALTLAESRYRAGAETLLALLDAQRSLYAAQDTAVQLKLARLLASVSLYRALGGGWSPRGAALADHSENGRAT
jgi:hypothetical protein